MGVGTIPTVREKEGEKRKKQGGLTAVDE